MTSNRYRSSQTWCKRRTRRWRKHKVSTHLRFSQTHELEDYVDHVLRFLPFLRVSQTSASVSPTMLKASFFYPFPCFLNMILSRVVLQLLDGFYPSPCSSNATAASSPLFIIMRFLPISVHLKLSCHLRRTSRSTVFYPSQFSSNTRGGT